MRTLRILFLGRAPELASPRRSTSELVSPCLSTSRLRHAPPSCFSACTCFSPCLSTLRARAATMFASRHAFQHARALSRTILVQYPSCPSPVAHLRAAFRHLYCLCCVFVLMFVRVLTRNKVSCLPYYLLPYKKGNHLD